MGYSPVKQTKLTRTSMWFDRDNLHNATIVSAKIAVSRTQLVDGLVKHCLATMPLREIADLVRPKIEDDDEGQPTQPDLFA